MEKLDALKQKLSKKRKLAVGCTLAGIPVGVAVSQIIKGPILEVLKNINLATHKDALHDQLMFVILDLEQRYVIKYGLSIPHKPETYLENLKANQAVYGENFKYVYDVYESNFKTAQDQIMYMNDVVGQSQAIGVGVGIASFLLVAGIPTAKYLMCKRKIKQLEKELNENKEVEMTA